MATGARAAVEAARALGLERDNVVDATLRNTGIVYVSATDHSTRGFPCKMTTAEWLAKAAVV